ncbi:1-acyl-sn-glycerol-3-phosphate acyltransferase [Caldalkalibacillus uzonensis]|uniref:1-acyl-sn-glycerol-3-phosphate acyltransferase n=1 Tax=Caldalkalibacillus uzonensis TaxID=353224 RepID=A0ABU0CRK8_9BACI|nr:lysophospholipid acyltransferase family protein [Caldalkalibacillus uzonensis]MDQ0338999.1 1-acyl-sn-glycerol-3-phosphate acyltransferase [Caldalkalibacillus uzonensis]
MAKWYLALLFKLDIVGLEHVPEKGAVIVAANHISNHDPIVIGYALERPIHFLAKKELFRFQWSAWLFHKLHAIPVDRQGGSVIRAVRRALAVLERAEVFGIFPEGTRCKEGEEVRPKKGVAFFSCKTGAPVLPVAIIRGKRRLRRHLTLRIGPPIDISRFDTRDYQVLAEAIMKEIRQLKAEQGAGKRAWKPEPV